MEEHDSSPFSTKQPTSRHPGQTGHTWILLKWVWKADPDRLVNLDIGLLPVRSKPHHPRPWKEAIVCVIPKPNRADYTLAKNY